MSREELIAECWQLALTRYDRECLHTRHPYVREKVWDAIVDTFFYCLRRYDGTRRLGAYFNVWVRRYITCAHRECYRPCRDIRRNQWLSGDMASAIDHRELRSKGRPGQSERQKAYRARKKAMQNAG